ncbi:unnamed protein product [Toxocara canis]|uniref:G_PROTEIN_RECEP_F1_2 domain-containing protein n=1 Tax=Toxocara canis TaxID=6265 RepID=A0A183VAB6_TOXCA|nr:unnamed protein product [Toxocara canis]
MFGMLTCRSHFIFVTAGRTMAGWAIALLFVDQYVVLALWKKIAGHLQAFFMCSLAMVALIASIVLVPSLFFVQINEVVLHEEHTSPNTLLRIRTFTCLTRLPRTFSPYANALNVILDFLMPLLVVLVMSRKTSIILAAANGSTRLCQKKICICLAVLATMHFIAYLPHWIAVFLVLVHDTWQLEAPQWLQTMLGDAVLLLPQITASTAWMPASYLSAQLCSRSYSYEMVTEASACRTSTLKRNSQMANTDFSRHSVAVTL